MAFLVSQYKKYYPRIQEVPTREEADALAKEWSASASRRDDVDIDDPEYDSLDSNIVYVSEILSKNEQKGCW